jgi:D-alanyl-D-alanine carboxypeptidase
MTSRVESHQVADALNRRLELLLRRSVAWGGGTHALLAIERGDGSLRWVGAAGMAGPTGALMRPDTPFFIASITKLYIAATIMALHERGMVALAAPVGAYLPVMYASGLHRLHGTDYTETITIRHLLGHTSGLPDYIEDRPPGGRSLVERLVAEGDRSWGLDEVVETVRRLRPYFPPQDLERPRVRVRYSDTNYRLLIAIIETVTGRPLNEVYADLLFRPLNLRHTWVPGAAPLDASAEPATLSVGNQPLHLPKAMRAFGDLFSTAGDLHLFLRALMRGDVFDDPRTLGLMQQQWNRFGFPRDRAALRAPGWPIEYGLGLMRFQLPRVFTPFRRMPPVIGHTGSTGTWLLYCPDLDLLLSGTVDQVTAGALPFRLVPKLLRLVESHRPVPPGAGQVRR